MEHYTQKKINFVRTKYLQMMQIIENENEYCKLYSD